MADAGFSFEQQDRLAELGRIAGPLVHELKNPLGVILLNAELMAKDLPRLPEAERERVAKRLRRIDESARNLQMVVQSFLAYARPVRPEPGAIDLNLELRRVLDEQHDALDAAAIEVHFRPDPALCLVPGDRGHLRSIFTNIIVNARDALRERPSDRRLVVLTRTAQNASRVVIANNGPPLPEGVAARLFEPFTSTKEHGTGLGLAIVRRLVEMHNGTVTVSSDRDQGVSFTCEFPTPLGPSLAQGEIGYAGSGDAPAERLTDPEPPTPRRTKAKPAPPPRRRPNSRQR